MHRFLYLYTIYYIYMICIYQSQLSCVGLRCVGAASTDCQQKKSLQLIQEPFFISYHVLKQDRMEWNAPHSWSGMSGIRW